MTDIRSMIITAIEDRFVHTLRVDLEEDVPALADEILAIVNQHWTLITLTALDASPTPGEN